MMAAALAALSGCASLPANAPTSHQVQHSLKRGDMPYTLVDIDTKVAMTPTPPNRLPLLQLEALGAGPGTGAERTDLIRPGDTLTIAIYEVGVSLFANAAPAALAGDAGPTANAQRITVQVRDDGTIDLPYIGTLKAEGTYPESLAAEIKGRLRRFSESPEALVGITDTVENVAYVSGLVAKSGRYRLSSARERLLDVIALAGGSTVEPADAELRIVRGDRVATVPLIALSPEDLANITGEARRPHPGAAPAQDLHGVRRDRQSRANAVRERDRFACRGDRQGRRPIGCARRRQGGLPVPVRGWRTRRQAAPGDLPAQPDATRKLLRRAAIPDPGQGRDPVRQRRGQPAHQVPLGYQPAVQSVRHDPGGYYRQMGASDAGGNRRLQSFDPDRDGSCHVRCDA